MIMNWKRTVPKPVYFVTCVMHHEDVAWGKPKECEIRTVKKYGPISFKEAFARRVKETRHIAYHDQAHLQSAHITTSTGEMF